MLKYTLLIPFIPNLTFLNTFPHSYTSISNLYLRALFGVETFDCFHFFRVEW